MAPPYISPLREAQAADTRRRILDAAASVFGEQGFSGTSLARIATAAGVSLETVKQQGPKSALLLAAFDNAFAGAEGDGPLHVREWGQQAASLPGDEMLVYLVDFVASANARVARLWPRVLDAGSSDREVATRLAMLQSSRRQDMLAAITLLRDKGVCTSPRHDDELASALSFLISPEGYTQLIIDAGWSESGYRTWVVEAVRRIVLQP